MDFNQLTAAKGVAGSIADAMNNSLIAPSVPFFIQEAESIIFRRLRHFRMLTTTTATMTPGTDLLSLPADFLDPYMLYITASASVPGYGPRLLPLSTPEQVIASYAWDGSGNRISNPPGRYYFSGAGLQLDAPPDQAYPYSLLYYAQPTALSGTNTTNWLTQYYPRLLRAAIMAQACEWVKESATGPYGRDYWVQVTLAELDAAQQESDFAKRSASNATGMIGLG